MGVQLPAYPMQPAPAWVMPYIGLPYADGARGPDQWDCWGLFLKVLAEQFGVAIPAYEGLYWERDDRESRVDAAAHFRTATVENFVPVEPGREQAGDGISLNIAGRPLHVGVTVSPGWMLHTSQTADASLERYDGMVWRRRVDGFWRHRSLA